MADASIKKQSELRIAFMFSGQGGQWSRMGCALYEQEPVFRIALDEIDRQFTQLSGWSVLEEIQADRNHSGIHTTTIVQPAIFAVQIALSRLLEHYGVYPDGLVGHSIGEVAAAHLAGALTLQEAVALIYYRSQIQNRLAGKGKMLAIKMSPEAVKALLKGIENRVSIATINGPEILTISGEAQELKTIGSHLDQRGIFNRLVKTEVPYHSPFMEEIREDLILALEQFQGRPTTLPLYSTVSGQQEPGTHLNGPYWYRNVREPVLLTKALESMLVDGFNCFIEIGPHPILVSGAQALFQTLGYAAEAWAVMNRQEPEQSTLRAILERLGNDRWGFQSGQGQATQSCSIQLPQRLLEQERDLTSGNVPQ